MIQLWIIKLIKFFLKKHRYDIGDLVTVYDASEVYEVNGVFFRADTLAPCYLLRDRMNRFHEQKEHHCGRFSGSTDDF